MNEQDNKEIVSDPQNPKITILDKEYFFKDLPINVQKMVSLYNAWNVELAKQQAETMKLELAMRGVTQDIIAAMTEIKPEDVPQNIARYNGIVKWYNDTKGFGFLLPDGSEQQIYVHYDDIEGDDKLKSFKTLREGQRVSFLIEGEDRAKNVKTID